ncbi:MAG: efflux RND transporter permease subunit [Acidobacteria bacterium]|nr:efflux RND transporter permease subunit [Acidobacteriota bacterium]
MKLAEFSIRRPIFTVMITLVIIIIGMVSLTRLPVDLMPEVVYPTLNINTSYANTGPEEIEELITRPVEEAMSAVPGVEEVFSSSSEGSSSVRVMFSWGVNLDAATDDVRERLDRIVGRLPEEVDRPTLRKFDPAQSPILQFGALSNLDPVQTRRIIDEQIAYRLERVAGVASIDVFGGREREIQVNLDPDKLKALGLPLDVITSKIRQENIDMPAGVIEKGNYEVLVRIPGVFTGLDQLRDTVIAFRDGVPIQLKEIASVDDSFRRITRVVRINDMAGTRLAVYKQSGENTVRVAEGVLKEIAEIQRDLPQIQIVPVSNSAEYIKRAINNVGSSALVGGVLAVLALLVFLASIRSTLVIAVSIPISLIGTIALIYFGGFTLNTMTLGGLALGIGMLVDSSIVVLENIYRMQEGGVPRLKAAIDGTNEVAAPIIAGALTTCVVFLPMIFIRGMSGVMFKQLAYVVSFANLCGLFVALTMVPMLSSRLIHVVVPPGPHSRKPLERIVRILLNGFRKMENGYKALLHKALDHRALVLGFTGLLLVGCLFLIRLVGTEFMPATDESEVRVTVEMEVGTRLEVMNRKFLTVTEIVKREVPEMVGHEESFGGGGWRSGANSGNLTIKLKTRGERSRSSEQIAVDLRKKLADIPGVVIRTRASGGQMMFGMRGGGGQERLQVEIRGYDLSVSEAMARQVKGLVGAVKGVTDVRISREIGNPEELFIIDRQAAADMKLSVNDIGRSIQTVLTGTQASVFREAGREFRILVKVKDSEKMDIQSILDLTIMNAAGDQVSLRNVVNVQPRRGPIRIERRDRERVVTVSGEISGRDLGSVMADTREVLRSVPIPRNFSIGFTGDYEEQRKANRELLLSIILALVLVYMIMAMLYESLRDPFIVMFSVPLAAIGVILMLFLTRTSFNIQSYIGCIMLGGIVVNNAIIIVDYTNLLRQRDKMPIRQAIEEAGRRRLRPILMTAFTAVMATLPLALGLGEGGEAQAPLARSVIGGLTSSTLITLIVVPVIYSLFEDFRRRKERAGGGL